MRLGGPILEIHPDPDAWIQALRKRGYRAAYCPLAPHERDEDKIRAYARAAGAADIVIAEVGTWSNPLSADAEERTAALETCKQGLALADRIGARCCVNIAGSRGRRWDGPDPRNLTEATFDQIVETVREIIDAVKPKRTFYTLETMPWIYPDSPEAYLRLLRSIDRERFAVHLDPVNLVNSPARYFQNARLIRECFEKLGPYIKSCHAKDIRLAERLTVHLDEARPGTGGLDYRVLLQELARLDEDVPLMLEHLPSEQDYVFAAEYIRTVARELGLKL